MRCLRYDPSRAAADTLLRSAANHRDGATLSEILISLMVMGIGVTSLALLISTSVLRSIQANQLTNSTIHRLNAEQVITLFPRLIHDPNNNSNLIEHEISGGADNPNNAVDGVNEGRFIVDPLGATNTNLTVAVRGTFGNDAGAAPTNPINRYSGGFNATTAIIAAYLPDTWQTAAKGIAQSPSATDFNAPSGVDLTDADNAIAAGIAVRAILFTANGRQSFVRDSVTGGLDITGQNVFWNEALPTGTVISRFRVETYDPRYSWLLTVRKTPGPALGQPSGQGRASVDVVIFHKRAYSEKAEQRFVVQSWVGNECRLNLTSTNALAGGPKPFLKKGGFLFDAQHANWYRIVKVVEDAVSPTITLDRSVVAPVNPSTGAKVPPTHVLAMPGIVEVYPIGNIIFDADNTP